MMHGETKIKIIKVCRKPSSEISCKYINVQ